MPSPANNSSAVIFNIDPNEQRQNDQQAVPAAGGRVANIGQADNNSVTPIQGNNGATPVESNANREAGQNNRLARIIPGFLKRNNSAENNNNASRSNNTEGGSTSPLRLTKRDAVVAGVAAGGAVGLMALVQNHGAVGGALASAGEAIAGAFVTAGKAIGGAFATAGQSIASFAPTAAGVATLGGAGFGALAAGGLAVFKRQTTNYNLALKLEAIRDVASNRRNTELSANDFELKPWEIKRLSGLGLITVTQAPSDQQTDTKFTIDADQAAINKVKSRAKTLQSLGGAALVAGAVGAGVTIGMLGGPVVAGLAGAVGAGVAYALIREIGSNSSNAAGEFAKNLKTSELEQRVAGLEKNARNPNVERALANNLFQAGDRGFVFVDQDDNTPDEAEEISDAEKLVQQAKADHLYNSGDKGFVMLNPAQQAKAARQARVAKHRVVAQEAAQVGNQRLKAGQVAKEAAQVVNQRHKAGQVAKEAAEKAANTNITENAIKANMSEDNKLLLDNLRVVGGDSAVNEFWNMALNRSDEIDTSSEKAQIAKVLDKDTNEEANAFIGQQLANFIEACLKSEDKPLN